jgi:hypothetical protein
MASCGALTPCKSPLAGMAMLRLGQLALRVAPALRTAQPPRAAFSRFTLVGEELAVKRHRVELSLSQTAVLKPQRQLGAAAASAVRRRTAERATTEAAIDALARDIVQTAARENVRDALLRRVGLAGEVAAVKAALSEAVPAEQALADQRYLLSRGVFVDIGTLAMRGVAGLSGAAGLPSTAQQLLAARDAGEETPEDAALKAFAEQRAGKCDFDEFMAFAQLYARRQQDGAAYLSTYFARDLEKAVAQGAEARLEREGLVDASSDAARLSPAERRVAATAAALASLRVALSQMPNELIALGRSLSSGMCACPPRVCARSPVTCAHASSIRCCVSADRSSSKYKAVPSSPMGEDSIVRETRARDRAAAAAAGNGSDLLGVQDRINGQVSQGLVPRFASNPVRPPHAMRRCDVLTDDRAGTCAAARNRRRFPCLGEGSLKHAVRVTHVCAPQPRDRSGHPLSTNAQAADAVRRCRPQPAD